MATKLVLLALLALAVCDRISANPGGREKRVKRVPLQRDGATQGSQQPVSGIALSLSPSGTVNMSEKDSITFECTATNKPTGSQIQWYYIVRSGDGQSFENFTILANEDSTINNNKYHVWTTPGDRYALQVNNLKPSDSGEYCCFLFISYSETYREITIVNVQSEKEQKEFDLNRIIEEVVEEDMEAEVGRKLNMTVIRNNEQAQTLIHNAAEEIKSLLHINQSDVESFQNDSTRLTITRKMNGMSSQVKTVVTSLLSQMSSVDSTLARALTPASGIGNPTSYAGRSNKVPDWRRIYNEYKERVNSEDVSNEDEERPTILNSVPSYRDDRSDAERERLEETHNTVEMPITATKLLGTETSEEAAPVHKCQYQLIVNEFDPNQCPSINSPRPAAAAARYYEEDNRATAIRPAPVETEQLTRLENRLIDEMVNAKMVNQTVNMHDSMLQKTEKMLEEQTSNLTSMASTIQELKGKLQRSDEEKQNMEDKLTEVMVNILEVNKRLDVALSRSSNAEPFTKVIGVESAPDSIGCDRHPNVTHFQDCADAQLEGNQKSGVYYIRPLYSACPIPVWCDMDTYPGGWTVVQRREGGKVNFNRIWDSYRKGFGEVTGEHWLGNDNLFLMSNQAEYMLRVDLWDFYGSRVYSEYRIFKLEGERDGYRLTVGNYSGTAGDGMKTHNRQKFSTPDRDGDMWEDYHCALEWEGGWWFTNCWSSYLNGRYYNVSDPPYNGISWREWKEEQLYKSEMKIRPVWSASRSTQVEDEEVVPEMESDEEVSESSESDNIQNDEPRHAHRQTVSRKRNMATVSRK